MATKVDKAAFPSLVAKMWPHVLLPEQLTGSFRGSGNHPLSRDAIPASKLNISVPFTAEPSSQGPSTLRSLASTTSRSASPSTTSGSSGPSTTSGSSGPSTTTSSRSMRPSTTSSRQQLQHHLCLHLSAASSTRSDISTQPQATPLQPPPTPVTIHIAQIFGNLFVSRGVRVASTAVIGWTQPRHYREALTEDEIFANSKRKRRKLPKKENQENNVGRNNSNHAERKSVERMRVLVKVVEATMMMMQRKHGLGCDERGCWRWHHYWCAGHLDRPDPKLKWICPACKED